MAQGWLQIAVFLVVVIALTPPLGAYMARVFRNERVFLTPILGGAERLTYRILRVEPVDDQDWKSYAGCVILFSGLSWLALYLILRTQGVQPLNPAGFDSGPWDVSFNTASSFVSNTNWQYYGGETTLSYFAQMAGLTVQNFVTPAVGICVLVALVRGIIARGGEGLGNFWQDLVRSLYYVLLPLSIVVALILVSQGVLQTLGSAVTAWRVPTRPWRSGLSPRRLRSRNSAPTAAASSTSTPPCRSRTRPSSRTSSSCCRSS
jgi:K+-transporting ATPase ATPase A chain